MFPKPNRAEFLSSIKKSFPRTRKRLFAILLPALRERGSDILLLAEYFLGLASQPRKSLSAAAAKRLLEHPWPGNVRELENAMRSASLAVRGNIVDAADLRLLGPSLGQEFRIDDLLQLDYHAAISRLEKLLLERALNKANGNRAEAARILNIHRQLLYAKLKEHGLSKPDDP
jgi:two-component system, NtrC family, response regulator